MRKIVNVNEAAKYYLDGKKVRRYITTKMFVEAREKAKSEGKYFNTDHIWKGLWLWLDEKGKRCSNREEQTISLKEYQFQTENQNIFFSRAYSPLEVIEKEGFNKEKKWEVEL